MASSHSSISPQNMGLTSESRMSLPSSMKGQSLLLSPPRGRRIPPGPIIARIPLESAKAYPIRIWQGLGHNPRIAYSDRNSHNEDPKLNIKVVPGGGKTAPHPQLALYVDGPYHVESLGYLKTDPFKWKTWMEVHLDARDLDQLIHCLIMARQELERQ